MERILRRAGWSLRRIGKPRALGSTLAVAGYLEVSIESLARIRATGGIQGPVLWAPVVIAAQTKFGTVMAVGQDCPRRERFYRRQALLGDSDSICVAILNFEKKMVKHMNHDSKSKNAFRRNLTAAVDLVHLRYAVAAADHGSFRRAAEALLLKQSKLSRCVRQLEERIGMVVFDRSSGGARATQAGRNFLRMARSILEQMDTLVTSAHSAGRGEACACRKSNPKIFVVQSAEDWAAKNAPCPLHGARSGRILIQGQVRAGLIIVAGVRFQNAAQMHLAHDNDVVQTLPADRSDQPFGKAVLPG
jgi:Bacterial regulatory helix-turn-helix protein, lysR family/Autoinducer synthase